MALLDPIHRWQKHMERHLASLVRGRYKPRPQSTSHFPGMALIKGVSGIATVGKDVEKVRPWDMVGRG